MNCYDPTYASEKFKKDTRLIRQQQNIHLLRIAHPIETIPKTEHTPERGTFQNLFRGTHMNNQENDFQYPKDAEGYIPSSGHLEKLEKIQERPKTTNFG